MTEKIIAKNQPKVFSEFLFELFTLPDPLFNHRTIFNFKFC